MAHILPSLISADILRLKDQIELLNPYADGYHIDIMDFNFVPNLTWGPIFVNAIKTITEKPLYIHLMVCDPKKYFNILKLSKNDIINFHIERCPNTTSINYDYAKECIIAIKKNGLKASLAIKPSTSITTLEPLIEEIDDILLMSVEPGFSGQTFLDISYKRLKELLALKKQRQAFFTISMDGGINENTIQKLTQMGVNSFGIASGIFNQKNPIEALIKLKKLSNY